MAAKFIALVASALIASSAHALADNYGPHPDLRAIYHDLPIVETRWGAIHVDGVVVLGNEAIAQTHIGDAVHLELLRRRYDRWWLEGRWPEGEICGDDLFLNSPVRDLALHHLSAAPSIRGAKCTMKVAPPEFDGGWYDMTWTLAKNDAEIGRMPMDWRAPTEAESWMVRGGNSYFFFSGDAPQHYPVHFQSGTTIDVWFPFVLPPEKKYSLTIGYTDEPIGPIEGTLKDNTLHFVLPAFSVKPRAHLMAEIDGNPPGL